MFLVHFFILFFPGAGCFTYAFFKMRLLLWMAFLSLSPPPIAGISMHAAFTIYYTVSIDVCKSTVCFKLGNNNGLNYNGKLVLVYLYKHQVSWHLFLYVWS